MNSDLEDWKDWDKFLEQLASNYKLHGRRKEVFLVRFAYENWDIRDAEVWELARISSHEAYKKQMTKLYTFFSEESDGCSELQLANQGPGKFQILLDWLQERYSKWQSSSTPVTSGVNYFDYEKPVPLSSSFYVSRPPVESECYEVIQQPGALIRIKAPTKMGKTSLLDRIIEHANEQGYRAVRLNLLQVETAKLGDLDNFLRWFCTDVSDRLQPPDQLNEYWNQDRGSMTSCTRYFEMLLEQEDSPLVLGLDGVDRVFEYSEISQDFFYLLRSWHEEANNLEIWEQLRLVIVHCTEDYGRLDIERSPFNVGLPMELEELTQKQVQDLAQRHQLDWQDTQVQQLWAMVGGHPYLVQLALAYLAAHPHVGLEQLLQAALTNAGIYGRHLRPLLITLREHPQLAAVLKQVVSTTEPVKLDSILGYRLYSMGLIKWQGDRAVPRCELYRQYFQARLAEG